MENYPLLPPDHEAPISVDFALLAEVVRRNILLLSLTGVGVFGMFTAWQLCFVPQTYRAEVSIAMQQATSSMGGLSSLLGASTQSKKYIGLLKSRNLAETVENQVHLQQFYKLKTRQDALDLLMDNMKPEDSATDGLLIIRLSLPGPPAYGQHAALQRERARETVATATNLYAKALSDYYDVSNTERDNVLLHLAQDETASARQEYDLATQNIRDFVRNLDKVPVRSTPTSLTVEAGGASQDLVVLYEEQDRVEADMRATLAVQQTHRRMTADQLKHLNVLPAEDILLNDARAAKTRAETALKKRLDIYGPDNPLVKEAEDNLRRANDELNRQTKGISQLLTTDQVDIVKKLEGLRAKRQTILDRIAQLENTVPKRRELTARLEFLRNEQILALKRLQEAIVKSVEVRLSAVSGKSMITIVDTALPPRQGSPSLFRTFIVGGLLALLSMMALIVAEYLKQARRKTKAALKFALSSVNHAYMRSNSGNRSENHADHYGESDSTNESVTVSHTAHPTVATDSGNLNAYPPV